MARLPLGREHLERHAAEASRLHVRREPKQRTVAVAAATQQASSAAAERPPRQVASEYSRRRRHSGGRGEESRARAALAVPRQRQVEIVNVVQCQWQ